MKTYWPFKLENDNWKLVSISELIETYWFYYKQKCKKRIIDSIQNIKTQFENL